MINKIINNEVFHFKVELVFFEKESEIEETIKRLWKKYNEEYKFEDNYEWCFYYNERSDDWLLLLRSKDINVIAHEIVHIVTRLCDSRGIPIRLENDEVMAYLIQWYMKEISKILKLNKILW